MRTLPYSDRRGPMAGNCRTSEETIHKVCQMLQDKPTVGARIVARLHGIQHGVVCAIVKGTCWAHISAEYDLSARHEYNMKWGPMSPARKAKQLERRKEQQRKEQQTTKRKTTN